MRSDKLPPPSPQGEIEYLDKAGIPDESQDIIISNCVVRGEGGTHGEGQRGAGWEGGRVGGDVRARMDIIVSNCVVSGGGGSMKGREMGWDGASSREWCMLGGRGTEL